VEKKRGCPQSREQTFAARPFLKDTTPECVPITMGGKGVERKEKVNAVHGTGFPGGKK